ncbi:unnamed protein product [Tilletia controversa]|nr:unnamed protein product [Tilletia controversa]CAD6927939.1 unnamed protein product [Tilletia controversa]
MKFAVVASILILRAAPILAARGRERIPARSGGGDFVSDTPPQNGATSGCPTSKDTRPGGGVDSIHSQLHGFTNGQIMRMHSLTQTYRGI